MGVLQSIFGKKARVPELEKLDPGAVQQAAIANNLKALPGAEELVSKANIFSRGEIDKMLAAQGMGGLLKQGAGVSEKMMRGELPLGDIAMSQLGSVAKSFGGGFAGAGAMGSLVARDLGIRMVDQISKGMDAAQSWLRTASALYQPTMIGLKDMFLTTEQQYNMQNEQNLQQFQRKWMESQIEASPDPVLAGIHAEIAQYASSFVGSLGAGGGGGAPVSAKQFQQDYSSLGVSKGSNFRDSGGFGGNDWGGEMGGMGGTYTSGVRGGFDTPTFDSSALI